MAKALAPPRLLPLLACYMAFKAPAPSRTLSLLKADTAPYIPFLFSCLNKAQSAGIVRSNTVISEEASSSIQTPRKMIDFFLSPDDDADQLDSEDEFDVKMDFLPRPSEGGSSADQFADASATRKRPASKEEDEESLQRLGEGLQAKKKKKNTKKKEETPVSKKPATTTPLVMKKDEDPQIHMDSVKLEGPYPNGKCYIRHKPDGIKPQSLVNLDKKKCKKNGEIMKKVLQFIMKTHGCRKSSAVAERDRLMSK